MSETYEANLLRRLAALLDKRGKLLAFPDDDGDLIGVDITWVFGRSCTGYEEMRLAVGQIIRGDFARLRAIVMAGVEHEITGIRAELKSLDPV